MKIKARPGDFRVEELLREGYVVPRGPFRVYRVTKRKLTSLEAAAELAGMLGVSPSDVGLAGLKDRQGVTVQYMSAPSGRPLRVRDGDLRVETVGSARESLTAEWSEGNAFAITVRDVTARELDRALVVGEEVRRAGVPNYFDDQRFGNLRYNQGWIARDLCLGRAEAALKRFLCATSDGDDRGSRTYKGLIRANWGDWSTCREISARYGRNHTLFRHLQRRPGDFAGAFRYVASRLRLIHLYAFQSHLWNRAVARWMRELGRPGELRTVASLEGPFVFPGRELGPGEVTSTFRLPGPGLEDVEHEDQRRLLTEALRAERMQPRDFRIEGVPGFALKGEDRALFVRPSSFELAPVRPDRGPRTGRLLVSFELPRGSYATLVLRRLFERPPEPYRRGKDAGDDPHGRPYRGGGHGEDRGDGGAGRYNRRGSKGGRPGRRRDDGGRSDAPRRGRKQDRSEGRRDEGRSAGRRDRGLGALRDRGSG